MSQSGPYNAVPLDEPSTPSPAHTPLPSSPPHTPLPHDTSASQYRFLGQDPASIRESYASSLPIGAEDASSARSLQHNEPQEDANIAEKGSTERGAGASTSHRKRNLIIGLAVLAVVIIVIVIVVPVTVIKKKNDGNASGASSGSSDGGDGSSGSDGHGNGGGVVAAVTGGDGSEVTLEDGSTFKYSNPYGGRWYYDVNDPFNNGARPQSWSPALNESFKYGIDKIRGVNLGGWLVLEPNSFFRCPAPFEKYQPQAVDEYTLHQAMGADLPTVLEEHYNTFITEKDFAEIAGAGLNYVRIPLPYWAVETHPDEPFLPKVAWKYFLKAIQWSRKYGLRINLDLHTVPGSQNDWNHSGRRGSVNFLHGPMGWANAQRTLEIVRTIAEFISQKEYRDVVTMFGFINEPRAVIIGQDPIASFYAQAYKVIREASGQGEGNGPWVAFHDAMMTKYDWKGFLHGGDRIALDSHPYTAFGDNQSPASWDSQYQTPCNWGNEFNQSMSDFGLSSAGEWSLGINDCGLWLNGIPEGTRYDGTYAGSQRVGDCSEWTDWEKWSDDKKSQAYKFALASMDGLQNYFFWTWKIGESSKSNKVESPAWSYQLGLEHGWIPKDPREATGQCGNNSPWTGTIALSSPSTPDFEAELAKYPWPPTSISEAGAPATDLPKYTPTGSISSLQGATFTASGARPTKSVSLGSGWANSQDSEGAMTAIQGCQYPGAWVDGAQINIPWCTGAKKREVDSLPRPTAAP
ncbi:glycoside hydrolase [Marasmius fiardii PR-910]|nr:glycoside hydrolase [Marasmius fiardii PR-910]